MLEKSHLIIRLLTITASLIFCTIVQDFREGLLGHALYIYARAYDILLYVIIIVGYVYNIIHV